MEPAEPAREPDRRTIPPMCLACGQLLTGTETKCPSCGAPLRGRRPGSRSGKLTVALVLFIGLALLNATQAIFAAAGPDDSAMGQTIGPWSFPLTGVVRFENGSAASGVVVTIDRSNATQATTDANGTYHFASLPVGLHWVTFELANHTVAEYKVFLRPEEKVDATLRPGTGTETLEDDSYGFLRTLSIGSAVVSGALAALCAAGALACARRKRYGLALTAAWVSILGALTTAGITIILSIVAIVLLVRSKREFA